MFLILYYREFIKKRILRVNGLVKRIISVVKTWLTTQKKCGQGQKEEISSKSMLNIQLYRFRKGKLMKQILEVKATIPILIPEDMILIDKIEYQELKQQDFDGWVGMDVFTEKSNRSVPTISKVLRKPDLRKRISVENGGWVYYPNGKGDNWSFHYKEMMEFINNEFYQKFNGGSK